MHKTILVSQPPTLPNVPAGLPLDGLVAFYGFDERKNLLKYSQQFDNAAWSKSEITVTANAALAPDGTMTADSVSEMTTADPKYHRMYQTIGAIVAGRQYVYSCYMKKGTRDYSILATYNSSTGSNSAAFNLATGVCQTPVSGIAPDGMGMQPVGDGWYRCWIIFTALNNGQAIYIYTSYDATLNTYAGDSTLYSDAIYIWGAQLEAGSYANTYFPTTDKQTVMDYSKPRKNLLLPNQANGGEDGTTLGFFKRTEGDTVTSSTEQAWQGSRSIKVVTANAANAEGTRTDNYSVNGAVAGKTYTASVYVRGTGTVNFRLYEITGWSGPTATITLTDVWTRYSVTLTLAGNVAGVSLSLQTPTKQAATFWVDGLQIEEGDTATAWEAPPNIGTLGSQLGTDTNDPTWTGRGLLYGADDSVTFGPILDRSGAVANMGTMLMAFYTPATINAAATKLCSYSLGTGMAIYFGAVAGAPENNIVTVQYDGAGSYTSWCDAVAGIAAGWHTVAIVWNGAAYDIWIDGDLKTTTSAGSPALLPLSNANCCYDGTTYGNGLIRAARGVWDRGLAPSEVARATRAIKAELAGAVVLP